MAKTLFSFDHFLFHHFSSACQLIKINLDATYSIILKKSFILIEKKYFYDIFLNVEIYKAACILY